MPSRVLVAALALFLAPVATQAQTIKARGAAAAGVCAGALDLYGEFVDRAQGSNPEKATQIARMRDFFAEIPQYDQGEVRANAQAFVRLMSQRMQAATTDADRQRITREIVELSRNCVQTARAAARGSVPRQGAATPLPAPTPVPEGAYIPQGPLDPQ